MKTLFSRFASQSIQKHCEEQHFSHVIKLQNGLYQVHVWDVIYTVSIWINNSIQRQLTHNQCFKLIYNKCIIKRLSRVQSLNIWLICLLQVKILLDLLLLVLIVLKHINRQMISLCVAFNETRRLLCLVAKFIVQTIK